MNLLAAKIIVSLVALFGLGVATGYVIGHRPAPVLMAPPPPVAGLTNRPQLLAPGPAFLAAKRWREERLAELKASLKLSPEQTVAVARRFDEMSVDFRDVQMETRARINRVMQDMNQEIAKELTPEQRQTFWRMQRERMERMKPGSN